MKRNKNEAHHQFFGDLLSLLNCPELWSFLFVLSASSEIITEAYTSSEFLSQNVYILLCCQRTSFPTTFDCPSAVARGCYSSLFVRVILKSLPNMESENLKIVLLGESQACHLSGGHRNHPSKDPLVALIAQITFGLYQI